MRQDLTAQFRRRHDRSALLADGHRRGRIRQPQRVFPIGPGGARHREHGGDRVAGAGDVAHLDRIGRHVNGLALARHQRHAVFALRHQDGLAIGQLHRVLRGCGDALI